MVGIKLNGKKKIDVGNINVNIVPQGVIRGSVNRVTKIKGVSAVDVKSKVPLNANDIVNSFKVRRAR